VSAWRRAWRPRRAAEESRWTGAYESYDLAKVLTIAAGVVTLLAVGLSVLFSSPDERPNTIKQWSLQRPINFLETAISELARTSVTAEYGPPYNHGPEVRHAAFLYPQKWLGVTHPIDTARDYVIGPVRAIRGDPMLQGEISEYLGAPSFQKEDGIGSFENALRYVTVASDRSAKVRPGEYENVNNVMNALLGAAQSGALDGDLLTSGQLFQTDYTKPLLLMSDGRLFEERAQREHLLGRQWAMMGETGSYPSQPWLWPYAFWYQVEPFKASENADILVWLVMVALALVFICVPLLPGVRSLPRLVPIHRLIWREHYKR
jgi:hypothetical protein